jgi:hypothetical protein
MSTVFAAVSARLEIAIAVFGDSFEQHINIPPTLNEH